jgi:hypothetical protein
MKYVALLFALMLVAPVAVSAQGGSFNGRMWLAHVPNFPTTADEAYGQWVEDAQGNRLVTGTGFANVDQGVNQAMQQAVQGMSGGGGGGGGGARTVSEHDQRILQKINNVDYTVQSTVMQKFMETQTKLNQLATAWDGDVQALAPKEQADLNQLPSCQGESGVPSSADTAKVKMQYADQRMQIANQYLGQMRQLVTELHAALLPQIDAGDDAQAGWNSLEGAGTKQMSAPAVLSRYQQGLNAVMMYEQLVENFSQKAASVAWERKKLDRQYADAGGCS